VNRARKIAMLICGVSVLPIMMMPYVESLWMAVGLFGLAAAAHQGWSANIFTTASDMFPRRTVGSIVGVGGMAGAIGGATMAVATGYILESTGGNYMAIFFAVGPLYLIALALIHLLAPRLQPVEESALLAPRPFSAGSFLGFGFVGLILGTFLGWCLGLLSKQTGGFLLVYMGWGSALGAVAAVVLGNMTLGRKRAA
jgi:MFS family permease